MQIAAACEHFFVHRGVSALDSLSTLQWQTVLLAMEKRHFSSGEVVVQKVGSCLAVQSCMLHDGKGNLRIFLTVLHVLC